MGVRSWLSGMLRHARGRGAGRGRRYGGPRPTASPAASPTDPAAIAPVGGRAIQPVAGQLRRAFAVVAGFSFFINLLILTSPLYMLQVFDRVLTGGRWETLLMLTIIAGIALAIMGLLEAVRGMTLGRIGRWVYQRLAPGLLQAGLLGKTRRGGEANQALRDLGIVRSFLSSPSTNVILDAPWVPFFLAIIWAMHPMLGAVALCGALALFAIALANDMLSRGPVKDSGELSQKAGLYADAALRGTEAIRAMGMAGGVLSHWAQVQAPALDRHLEASDRSAALLGFSRFARLFVQVLILGTGAALILRGELTPGGMIAASIMLGRGLAPLEQAVGGWRAMINAREAYHRLRDVMRAIAEDDGQLPLPPPNGRLECSNVGLRLPDSDKAVLRGISFDLDPGQAIGLIGPSGAGKTMLCRVLTGVLTPLVGEVRLDGIQLHARQSAEIGPFIGYVPQDVALMGGSVASNIARLSDRYDPKAVIEAAQMAHAHRMILDLPEGYETEIGEGGLRLSGGQRQRLALARAFFGKPRLLILDEPNSNLDSEGETALEQAIEHAKGWGAAIVLVTHQARLLRATEHILFLRGGVAEFFGPSEDFMRRMRSIEENARGKAIEGSAKPRLEHEQG